jgi:GTP-binding protein
VLNKIDAIDPETLAERKAALEEVTGAPVHLMSGVSKEGVNTVLRALWSEIEDDRRAEDKEEPWTP